MSQREVARKPRKQTRKKQTPQLGRKTVQATPDIRQPARETDPYSILGLHFRASKDQIAEAYSNKLLKIDIDDVDPSSPGHQELTDLSNARAVLENEYLKKWIDCGLQKTLLPESIHFSAWEYLGVVRDPTQNQIDAAYKARCEEWSGYERVASLVFRMFEKAKEALEKELVQRNSIARQNEIERQREIARNARHDSVPECGN